MKITKPYAFNFTSGPFDSSDQSEEIVEVSPYLACSRLSVVEGERKKKRGRTEIFHVLLHFFAINMLLKETLKLRMYL